MKKKDATSSGASEWSSTPTGRITPMDIQQKEFQVARFGAGYRMREVDEFLDQVTDALSALVAENERLLRGTGAPGPASTRDPAGPATDDADRAAVEAFLRREKGFLQDLGGLVQEHAEELRAMVRAARQGAPDAAAPRQDPTMEPAAAAAAFEAAPEAQDEPDALQGRVDDADATGTTEEGMTATDPSLEGATHEIEDEGADADDDPEPPGGSAMTITEAAADEPIRLADPEPARSGRPEEKEDGSLRELFWGEE